MDDQTIVLKFFERDESALEESKKKYGDYCLYIADNVLRDRRDSEECLNDTWLGAWNSIPPARPACLSAFLAKITRNLAISKYRAKYAKKRTGDRLSESLDELGECIPVSNDNVSQAIDRRILAEAINGYLDTCSEKQRKIFVRRFFYFDSIAEISQMYGIGQSDVKVTLMRMRRSLQKILEEEELM